MLILAGVSINAIVGEDGVLSKAKDATYLQSCAVLEEFLQEKYVEYYDESEKYSSKPELLNAKINNLLLKDGTRDYIVNEGKIYYLINKPSLPKDIQKSLVGGDTTEWANYIRLNDVYGVTEDLKVYYCNNETGTVFGDMTASELDPNAPVTMINNDAGMKNAITSALADIGITVDPETGVTNSDISKIKDLKLDGNGNASGVTSLESLSEIRNMQTLTLSNMKLSSLKGIESLTNLYYIYFKNCEIDDYSQLCNNWNLQYLYMYLPPAMTETVANAQVTNLGNGLANADNLSKLANLGISGIYEIFEQPNFNIEGVVYQNQSNCSDVSALSLISDTIKSSVSYMYLNNNKVIDVGALQDFTNVTVFDLAFNPIQSFSNIGEHSKLEKLVANVVGVTNLSGLDNCINLKSLVITNIYSLVNLNGLDNCTNLENLNANYCQNLSDISALSRCTKLNKINFTWNKSIEHVSVLGNLVNLKALYLEECINMIDLELKNALVDPNTHIAQNCGSNFTYPAKYAYLFTASATSLDLSYSTLGKKLTSSSSEFVDLKWRTNVTRLNLSGQDQLTDSDLQDTLKTMTGLQALSLNDCSQLSSINFVGEGKVTNLKELDLRNTNALLTDLSLLNLYCDNLKTLVINSTHIKLERMQKAISKISNNGRNYTYLYDDSWITPEYWLCAGFIIDDVVDLYDFSKCSEITSFTSYAQIGTFNMTGNLDLSDCTSMERLSIWGQGSSLFKVIASASCSSIHLHGGTVADLSNCINLKSLELDGHYENTISTIINSLNMNAKITYLQIWRSRIKNLSWLKNIDTSELSTIYLCGESYIDTQLENLNGIEDCTNLNTFITSWSKTLTDISKLSNCTRLENVNISNCPNLTELKNLDNCQNISILTVKKCGLNNLRDILGLYNIKELYLSNNVISACPNSFLLKNMNKFEIDNNNLTDLKFLNDSIITSAEDSTVGANGKVTYTELNLSNNSITANQENVNTLIALHKAGLKKVYLTGNPIVNDSNYLTQIQNEFGAANVVIN